MLKPIHKDRFCFFSSKFPPKADQIKGIDKSCEIPYAKFAVRDDPETAKEGRVGVEELFILTRD